MLSVRLPPSLRPVNKASYMMQQAADHAHFQAGFYQLLKLAMPYDCQHWLLDVRRCPPCCAEQQQWLTQAFYPRAKATLQTLGPIHEA
jgi:hypothetical protein